MPDAYNQTHKQVSYIQSSSALMFFVLCCEAMFDSKSAQRHHRKLGACEKLAWVDRLEKFETLKCEKESNLFEFVKSNSSRSSIDNDKMQCLEMELVWAQMRLHQAVLRYQSEKSKRKKRKRKYLTDCNETVGNFKRLNEKNERSR
jgi:hypothetical protein